MTQFFPRHAILSPREAQRVQRMLDIHALHKGPACAPVGEWLVRQAKRTWPRFAGFRGPSMTNCKRQWTLLSYHHPAQLCWLWSVWFTLAPTDGHWWRVWGGYGTNRWFGVKYLFRVSIHYQPHNAWMLSRAAKTRLRAIVDAELARAA